MMRTACDQAVPGCSGVRVCPVHESSHPLCLSHLSCVSHVHGVQQFSKGFIARDETEKETVSGVYEI